MKLYHKGTEFAEHDHFKLKRFFSQLRAQTHPGAEDVKANTRWTERKLAALQRLANSRLRVEVEVHADKLDADFQHPPRVSEVTDDYLLQLHDREVNRLLREGKSGMSVVREYRAVAARLQSVFGDAKGNRLFAMWTVWTSNGEAYVREHYSRSTFYRARHDLEAAGVSWTRSSLPDLPNQLALPVDFAPIRTDPRHCSGSVQSTRPALAVWRGCPQLAT